MSDLMTYAETDMSREIAERAHAGTSFVPEQRAQQEINYYLGRMKAMEDALTPHVTDENREQIQAALEAYRVEFVRRFTAYLHVKARCVSTMIAGGSGFNVSRAEKANAAERKASDDFTDWQSRQLDHLLDAYDQHRLDNAPIRSDDPDAIQKLRDKIAEAEARHEQMKAQHLSDRNNYANIRRMKQRLSQLEAEQARPKAADRTATIRGVPVTIVENAEENRLQLVFDGKPPQEVRDLLNSNGFKWAPSQGAWQRLLNNNARFTVWRLLIDKV